jgi:site-specific DNA recombinase
MTTGDFHTTYTPIDQRDQLTVRAVILARSSDPSAKAEDMTSQVTQCEDFIQNMGWALLFDPYAFAESKSGMRNVARPVLDDVLKLAIRGAVDVIVCREFERIARSKGRRWQAIQTALDYGVEFRFANLPATRGKLDDSGMMRLYQEVREYMAEAEAEKIAERLMPARLRRYEDGLPHGKLYGYAPGERRKGSHGKPMGLLSWVMNEDEAKWMRWMFDWVDAQPLTDLSLRGMARELARRGAPTPRGASEWSATQVRNLLRNPKYGGQGRGLRYHSEWTLEQDPDSRSVREVLHIADRMADPERWRNETHPILPTAIPPIIDQAQWERVQAKLKDAAALNNRGAPRRADAEANSTLLDRGYIRCAECGGRMIRHRQTKSDHPYYRCYKSADRPSHPHIGFSVPARHVDALALRLLAKALTDPEKILEVAGAAEKQFIEATADAELAASALAAYHQRLAGITAEREKLLVAIASLRETTGTESVVAGIQARLAQLEQEREQAENDGEQAGPPRDHAQARLVFLRRLFSHRDTLFDPLTHQVGGAGDPQVVIREWLSVVYAAELLGTELDDHPTPDAESPIFHGETLLKALGVELGADEEALRGLYLDHQDDAGRDESDHLYAEIKSECVVYWLLAKMPAARVRKLLHDLEAVVKVKRGRTRAEIDAGVKKPPLAERVHLEVLGTVQVRTNVAKRNISS